MKTLDDARDLAEMMLALGRRAGREVVCLLTDMDQPLGRAVGNALEIREAIADAPRGGARRLHRARARCLRAAARALGSRRRRGRGPPSRRGRGRGRLGARRYERWIRGAGRRPRRDALARAPVVRERARRRARLRRCARRDRGRHRRAPSGRRAGARRRTRSTMQSASSAGEARRRGRRRATCSPRCTRATRRLPTRRPASVLAAYELGTIRRPNGRSCSTSRPEARSILRRGLAAPRPCRSCPRSRRFARGSRPCSTGGGSSGSNRRRAADEAARARRRRGRARGERVADRRPARQVSGFSLRVRSRAPGSPPHDGCFRHAPARDARRTIRTGALSSRSTTDRTSPIRDVRRFGTWLLLEPDEIEPISRHGSAPSRSSTVFTPRDLAARLARRRAPVKAAILDQRTVAGVGNIYADEALWRARIHPLREARSLDAEEVRRAAPHGPATRSSSASRARARR